ncbi:MAG: hypothetical protein ABW252_19615 [Polyangiales bacterium]
MQGVPRYVLLLVAACAACHASGAVTGKPGDRLAVDRLYPLRQGSVWTYDVDTGDGNPPTLAITRVTARDGALAEVSSGAAPIRYALRADGLYRDDRRAYVLKGPVKKGARWDVGQGAIAEVVEDDKRVSTPAGDFTGCVEVRETGGPSPKVVRTVFCPDVGPVEVESSMGLGITGATAGRSARVLARLGGYDFAPAAEAAAAPVEKVEQRR